VREREEDEGATRNKKRKVSPPEKEEGNRVKETASRYQSIQRECSVLHKTKRKSQGK